MKLRLLALAGVAALTAGAAFALTSVSAHAAPARNSHTDAVTFTCTINHWIRDVSAGNSWVGVDQSGGYQLTDQPTAVGYPTNFIFELCTDGNGQFYLQDQIPGAGTPNGHPWVGIDTLAHDAIATTATGPGPHEAFTFACAGPNAEVVHWAMSGDMFTIATKGLWAPDQSLGLPGTLYNISGLCP